MTDSPSRKANGRIQPGEVRNPAGANQYTYRRDFEEAIGRLCQGTLTDSERSLLPDRVSPDLVPEGITRGEAIAVVIVTGALRGESLRIATWRTPRPEHKISVRIL